ncbi:hypothetical protein H6F74_09840 [Trichocoleus sp. FACHB-90]|uniref:hypothetical protein n=1 Tax=Cyanophyceae TaxID=3028117 RepID=UPI0016850AEC|nr:hypothetical protein [Trichocoleus sp. FACHB-90]MBD1926542.1 hypothetical protein [Trichocoleus sp. FACHB-90]
MKKVKLEMEDEMRSEYHLKSLRIRRLGSERKSFGGIKMVDLQLGKVQTHYCDICSSWLDFCFDRYTLTYDSVTIYLLNIPLLRCAHCVKYYFPEKTKSLLLTVLDQAKKSGNTVVRLSPRQDYERRFEYGQVDFLYDHRDYENIPGLQRPWNNGSLTPVFFNLAVLNKYSQHPDYQLDLFSKTYGIIEKGSEFSIAFGINRNRKVFMWLGDIDKLPLNEQYYLRSENVESDHDLYSEFYESQIEVQFSNPSPENFLFHVRSETNQTCREERGGYLHTFEGEISKVIENLDRPVFWQEKHVKPVVEALNEVMVESLDTQFLKGELKDLCRKDDLKGLGSLKLFEKWIDKVLKCPKFADIALPFYVLYDFRILSSHLILDARREATLRSINQRLGLAEDNANYELIYDVLIGKLKESYEIIFAHLQAQPSK